MTSTTVASGIVRCCGDPLCRWPADRPGCASSPRGGWLGVLSAPPVDADDDADVFQVAVTFRMGRLGAPVIAEFSCPEPRTIVMHIVDGEGAGSVVETHATPIGTGPEGRPRTAVIEAVIATSDLSGFRYALRATPIIQPLMRAAATRLWRDDLAYAERRYALRTRGIH